jgi:sugar phosphate isomerase/epimerase
VAEARFGDTLVASHHTLAGALRGQPPAARFAHRVEAAAAAGYLGIGWRLDDHRRETALGTRPADIRAVLEASGVALVELEVLDDWWRPDERAARSLRDEAELLGMAEAYGGRHLTVCDVDEPDGTFGLDLAAERFAGICDRAADVGLLVALEYLPWSAIPDPATARAVVEGAGRPNGGLQVDAWHTFRGAARPARRSWRCSSTMPTPSGSAGGWRTRRGGGACRARAPSTSAAS